MRRRLVIIFFWVLIAAIGTGPFLLIRHWLGWNIPLDIVEKQAPACLPFASFAVKEGRRGPALRKLHAKTPRRFNPQSPNPGVDGQSVHEKIPEPLIPQPVFPSSPCRFAFRAVRR
jgi:hypothetical protein